MRCNVSAIGNWYKTERHSCTYFCRFRNYFSKFYVDVMMLYWTLKWRNNESGEVGINYESEENWSGAICELFNIIMLVFFLERDPNYGQPEPQYWFLYLTFWRRIFFFSNFKMWVIQKPNKVALWNKRHFEGKKWRLYSMFKIFSTVICWINI